MAEAMKLLFEEEDGSLSFGNHNLEEKAKVEDFKYQGDLLKVKTFKTMTKLEKNGLFVYESVPGTTVSNFVENAEGLHFQVSGNEDAQITVGLEDGKEYSIIVNEQEYGVVKANMSGKVSISVELNEQENVQVNIKKI